MNLNGRREGQGARTSAAFGRSLLFLMTVNVMCPPDILYSRRIAS
jgi:hypothetical protein